MQRINCTHASEVNDRLELSDHRCADGEARTSLHKIRQEEPVRWTAAGIGWHARAGIAPPEPALRGATTEGLARPRINAEFKYFAVG